MLSLDSVRAWLADETSWIEVQEDADGRLSARVGSDCHVRVGVEGDPPLLHIRQTIHQADTGADRAARTDRLRDAFERFVLGVGGLVDGSMAETSEGWAFELDARLYPEGVDRHTVLLTLDQQRKAAASLRLVIREVTAQLDFARVLSSRSPAIEHSTALSDQLRAALPEITQFSVGSAAPLIDDEQQPLGSLEPGRWYEVLSEIDGWIETADGRGSVGWVASSEVTRRRQVPAADLWGVGPQPPGPPPPGPPPPGPPPPGPPPPW